MVAASGSALTWHWAADRDPSGALDIGFPTQGEAESWLGEVYPDLLQQGIRAVSLREGDRLVYGPMSLEVE